MNRDRGPRHEDDDYSQSTNERDDPTDEERRESLNECLKDMQRMMDKVASLPLGMKQGE